MLLFKVFKAGKKFFKKMKQYKILFLIKIIKFVFISLILFLTLKILVPRDIA